MAYLCGLSVLNVKQPGDSERGQPPVVFPCCSSHSPDFQLPLLKGACTIQIDIGTSKKLVLCHCILVEGNVGELCGNLVPTDLLAFLTT